MINSWNRLIYRLWSPIYDQLLKIPIYQLGRQQAWDWANPQATESVLLIGIGTGADLHILPPTCHLSGIDVSESMLARARQKASKQGREFDFRIGSAEQLPWPDKTFDVVGMLLILSVVEDPAEAAKEAARVLKPDGRIVIFDKFLTGNKPASLLRKLANCLTSCFGTDINRRLADILTGSGLVVVERFRVAGSAFFQIVGLKKTVQPASGDGSGIDEEF